ncbi:membrane protein insertion efficiency factor YidD [Natranaerobius thermophilus]|uniref:Putative membrane protein insertion efficiency factor n=1 Tax=Natranaerobius thermophilus (strain ATCC BAA-1301 / DSM 18059 / JW/NM-WN-LF) TaxID=457570 RepID=B2A473_NATTJ|nr:membrane protein insertion efficiency factor YidD [Natranaerobius thermophilus]ACB86479.1 protein of unknown function DUF37 [Natranaerobius thermophilus JW/NM-WN-LF]
MIKKIIFIFIRAYQRIISPVLPKSCRFIPTCSEYAIQVIDKYGIFKGGTMAFKRIIKCHPFHEGGYDPVE